MQNSRQSWWARLATLLVFSIVFGLITTAFTPVAYAADPVGPPPGIWNGQRRQIPDRATARTELVGWRSRNAQHFLNPDGSFTAEVYRENRFYEDPTTHALLLVDNNLKPADRPGWTHMNTANRFSALFGRTAGTIPSARLELGDASVEFTPVGSRPGAGLANGNTITYPGAYPGAALRYDAVDWWSLIPSDQGGQRMEPTIRRKPGTWQITYGESSHVMHLFVDWRERFPPFCLKSMKWEPPYESTPLTIDHKLKILQHVAVWLKATGAEGIVIDELGYFDGDSLILDQGPSEYWEELQNHWVIQKRENGMIHLARRPL